MIRTKEKSFDRADCNLQSVFFFEKVNFTVVFILYSTFYSRRSTGNMDNDRIQRLMGRRARMETATSVVTGIAGVAGIVLLFLL